MGMAYLALQVV